MPNAKRGRDDPAVEVVGMIGIPEEFDGWDPESGTYVLPPALVSLNCRVRRVDGAFHRLVSQESQHQSA